MKYRMIERCRDAFPVRLMCDSLKVSSSGYYDGRDRPLSAHARDNQRLLSRIRSMHAESDGVLGAPRMRDDLRHEGETCRLNRVAPADAGRGHPGYPAEAALGQREDRSTVILHSNRVPSVYQWQVPDTS